MIVKSNDAAILSAMLQFPYDIRGQKKFESGSMEDQDATDHLEFNALNTSLKARDWLFRLSILYNERQYKSLDLDSVYKA